VHPMLDWRRTDQKLLQHRSAMLACDRGSRGKKPFHCTLLAFGDD
jgi:hypothetical protein